MAVNDATKSDILTLANYIRTMDNDELLVSLAGILDFFTSRGPDSVRIYEDADAAAVLAEGIKRGYAWRISTTQAGWSEDGAKALTEMRERQAAAAETTDGDAFDKALTHLVREGFGGPNIDATEDHDRYVVPSTQAYGIICKLGRPATPADIPAIVADLLRDWADGIGMSDPIVRARHELRRIGRAHLAVLMLDFLNNWNAR